MNRRGALTGVELRLLAFELAVGAGDRHPLAGAHPQQIDFEFRERREDVEEALADWIVGVIHRAPKRQADTAGGERVADRACVRDRAGRAGRASERRACRLTDRGERLLETGSRAVTTGQAVIEVNAVVADAEHPECVPLGREVLAFG
jgi:hypothetical protein